MDTRPDPEPSTQSSPLPQGPGLGPGARPERAVPGVPPAELFATFDRVVVINLARRRDRLEQFEQGLVNWPFKPPQRFEAFDGLAVDVPAEWDKGPGGWGCNLSHRAVVNAAIKDRVRGLLVLEDDAWPVPDFARLAGEFMAKVPQDWECLMFGGEHLARPTTISPGVVRCTGTTRLHAYAMRRRMMGNALQYWYHNPKHHCDLVLASIVWNFKTYAPDPFLIGQGVGYSDITCTYEPLRFLPKSSPGCASSMGEAEI
jgi:hypothetical protein